MMRKINIMFLTLMLAIPSLATPVMAASPNKELGPPTYVLNVLAKKEGWSPNGDFDNPDRHTIFIPEYGESNIYMTSGPGFAVLDGNAVDDGEARFELEKGRYTVRIAALGKPGYDLKIKGNSLFETDGDELLLVLGELSLKRSKGTPVWEDGTPLFMIEWSEILQVLGDLGIDFTDEWTEADLAAELGYAIGDDVWIFDFLDWLSENEESGIYFWNINNNGVKHFQVRFYN